MLQDRQHVVDYSWTHHSIQSPNSGPASLHVSSSPGPLPARPSTPLRGNLWDRFPARHLVRTLSLFAGLRRDLLMLFPPSNLGLRMSPLRLRCLLHQAAQLHLACSRVPSGEGGVLCFNVFAASMSGQFVRRLLGRVDTQIHWRIS